MQEMEEIKATAKKKEEYPSLPDTQGLSQKDILAGSGGFEGGRGEGGRSYSGDSQMISSNVREKCAAGRRVVGFTPIEQRMLQIRSYGAKSLEEAMLMEIKSYLKCELKIRPSDIEKLDIVKIFHPAKQDWNVLYVELGSEDQVDQLFSYTKGMKKDHRMVRWYPKQM